MGKYAQIVMGPAGAGKVRLTNSTATQELLAIFLHQVINRTASIGIMH